jgi:glycosyltransferase involved in cell wall biosynthesis
MRILIVVGFVIPVAAEKVGENKISFGGWVSGLVSNLSKIDGIELGVAMKSSQNQLIQHDIDNVKYYYLPTNNLNNLDVYIKDCKKVLDEFKPTILHLEGAEVFIANRFINCFKGKKVISVKGLYNDVQKYEFADINPISLLFTCNFRNIIFGSTQLYKKYFRDIKRRKIEIDSYKKANFVIGRTLYDKAHTLAINNSLVYFHNDEILREKFYYDKWSIDKMIPYTIIVGNGDIARKGLHNVLEALQILKIDYPTIRLYVTGYEAKTLKDKFTYKGYIQNIISKYNLTENVFFMGLLDEESMVDALINKHIYILPSFVENSSNTLGEAMLLGLPCIVSYCGGVSSLASDKDVLFYRSSDYVMLAQQIKRIFDNQIDIVQLSDNARKTAIDIFDKEKNSNALSDIYRNIIKNEV